MRTLSIQFGLVACLTLAGARASENGDAKSETPAHESSPLVEWKELYEHPAQWLGRKVRIQVQFHSHVDDWNPYMTRFGSGQFVAVQAWADEQFPWLVADYEAPAVRLFARRDGQCEWALRNSKPYARYELAGVVHEVFLDLPWIEIEDVRPLAEQIGEATVIHASRALEQTQQGAWKLAELEFDQALAGPLPDKARIELERLREETRAAGREGRLREPKRRN